MFNQSSEPVVVKGFGVDVICSPKNSLQFRVFLGKRVKGFVQGLVNVVRDGANVFPRMAFGDDREPFVEVLPPSELLAIFLYVLGVLFLELIGD